MVSLICSSASFDVRRNGTQCQSQMKNNVKTVVAFALSQVGVLTEDPVSNRTFDFLNWVLIELVVLHRGGVIL